MDPKTKQYRHPTLSKIRKYISTDSTSMLCGSSSRRIFLFSRWTWQRSLPLALSSTGERRQSGSRLEPGNLFLRLLRGLQIESSSAFLFVSLSVFFANFRGDLRRAVGRNEEFLEHSRKYSMSVFGGGTVINMFPACLRSIVGPLVALAGKRHLAICNRLCATVVEERLENNQRKKDDPNFQWDPPV